MTPVWRRILVLHLLVLPPCAGAEEAVTHQGRRYTGTLQANGFVLAGTEKPLPLEQIHHVDFPHHPAPLPRCQVTHQLVLWADQRLAGELLSVGAKEVRFRAAGGEVFTLARRQIHGVVQSDGYLSVWAEDFEDGKSTLSWLGRPVLSDEHAFSGKKSLLVNASAHEVALAVSAAQKLRAPYRATIYFFDPGSGPLGTAMIQFVFQAQESSPPVSLRLAGHYYNSQDAQGFRLKASQGWHILQLEWRGGQARLFIDDYYISAQTVPEDARLASCRFSFAGPGAMWFDALRLSMKVPEVRRTPGPPDLDEVWLAGGEQVFGSVTKADAHAVDMEAVFGKRPFRWTHVRGIFFQEQGNAPATKQSVEVRFRSAPSVTSDQLIGTIVDWNERELILQHAELGKLGVARSRLERMRFPDRPAK